MENELLRVRNGADSTADPDALMYYLVQIDAALIIQKQTETKKHRADLDAPGCPKGIGERAKRCWELRSGSDDN